MNSYVITITEVDDPEIALEELHGQLSAIILQKNSIGIVSVNPEFFSSGVYETIVKAVPFPVIGMSAYTQNANGETGIYLFSILVLSSDNCEFAYGVSDVIPEKGDVLAITQDFYKGLALDLTDRAKLAFLYAPYIMQQCSYNYLQAISEIDGRLPIFGSLASNELTKMMTDTITLCGEKMYNDRLVMLLVSGEISPQFYIGTITEKAVIMRNIGEVTAAKDHVVMEINNARASDFFEKIGIKDGADILLEGTLSFMIIADELDESGKVISSVARGLAAIEDGAALFGGRIPVGAVLSVAVTTKDVIVDTAREVLSRIKSEHSDKTALLYSCLGRQIALLDEPMMEYEIIREEFKNNNFNYVVSASGGEICPTFVTETEIYNREHDQSLIACVF